MAKSTLDVEMKWTPDPMVPGAFIVSIKVSGRPPKFSYIPPVTK